jgi:uncharacterized membrane protein YkvA (DUF1232 family)
MSNPPTPSPNPVNRAGLGAELVRIGQLAWKLLTDPRVPVLTKLIPIITFLYILSPVDFVPEAVFGPLGVVDDLTLLIIGIRGFIALSPSDIVERYRQQLGSSGAPSQAKGETIDGTYRVVDDH